MNATAYRQLEQVFARRHALEGALGILHWDAATMLPDGGAAVRGEQLAALQVACHQLLTAPALPELFDKAEADTSALDDWQQANLREMRRIWRHETAVPEELVSALARAGSACEHRWRTAKKENDFKAFAEVFAPVLALVREVAAAKADALKLAPYDALIDSYDPGHTQAMIDPLFAELAAFLPEFTEQVIAHQHNDTLALPALDMHVPAATQEKLSRRLMAALGFDFHHGRLDSSVHPFCGGGHGDIRITTTYAETNFPQTLMGVLHETGHAMYEFGLPEAWYRQPVGQARGMALHESQSLLVEMQVCRGKDFLAWALPVLKEEVGAALDHVSPALLAQNYHRVERSFIRIHADEVTYPAHILLRYDLEKKLIGGELEVQELPDAWNDGMEKLLGIRPQTDAEGCMQDIHWTDGSFGYFPSYTLGGMVAAQLYAAAKAQEPGIPEAIRRGDFVPLFSWLRENVHGKASRYDTQTLLTQATGEKLNVDHYKNHLKRRYLDA